MKRFIKGMELALLMGTMMAGCAPGSGDILPDQDTLMIFHNGTGPMCIEALAWLNTMQTEYPDLVVEEHLITNLANRALLEQLKTLHGQSQGVSTTFGFLPIVFFQGQAFSGLNDEVKQSLAELIGSMDAPSS